MLIFVRVIARLPVIRQLAILLITFFRTCAKFNYDRLHMDEVLGDLKSDNNKNSNS